MKKSFSISSYASQGSRSSNGQVKGLYDYDEAIITGGLEKKGLDMFNSTGCDMSTSWKAC